jgi:hypothetical protein
MNKLFTAIRNVFRRNETAHHVALFAAASMHWSKDPAVPYAGCGCRVCRAQPKKYKGYV